MAITGTFNGWNIVGMPTSPVAKSLDFTAQDTVGASASPFTGQEQFFDWQASWLETTLTLPPMTKANAQQWVAFLLELRGRANVFLWGDPTAAAPLGTGAGTPLVNGATQTGYSLATKGWTASATGVLMPGDQIAIGYRLYRNLDQANADGSGHATLNLWPQIRESPADSAALTLAYPQGLFRLKTNARKWSVNEGAIYGFEFDIREAI